MLKLAIMTQVSIDRFGRVLIPKKLRDKLGLNAGQTLVLSEQDGHLVLEPQQEQLQLKREEGLLVFEGGSFDPDVDIVALIKDQREERLQLQMSLGIPDLEAAS